MTKRGAARRTKKRRRPSLDKFIYNLTCQVGNNMI